MESPWPIGLQAGNEICHRYRKSSNVRYVLKISQSRKFSNAVTRSVRNVCKSCTTHLTCPTCRTTTSVPANDIAGLRTDFRANQMRDAIGSFTQRNRPNENVCNQCEQRQKVVAAAWRCSTCEKKYCQSCKQKHNRTPLFRRHAVRRILPSQNSTVTCRSCKVRLK